MPVGVFPGSFNPPTVAHLTVAEAAREQCGLDRIDLAISVTTLGKEHDRNLAPVADRLAALRRIVASRPWLGAIVTESSLLADIAAGYDVLVLGADKWGQVIDPRWYDGDVAARDAALDRLPRLAVAPRPPHELPAAEQLQENGGVVLAIDANHAPVSSTAVRAGRHDWLALELREELDRARSHRSSPPGAP